MVEAAGADLHLPLELGDAQRAPLREEEDDPTPLLVPQGH